MLVRLIVACSLSIAGFVLWPAVARAEEVRVHLNAAGEAALATCVMANVSP